MAQVTSLRSPEEKTLDSSIEAVCRVWGIELSQLTSESQALDTVAYLVCRRVEESSHIRLTLRQQLIEDTLNISLKQIRESFEKIEDLLRRSPEDSLAENVRNVERLLITTQESIKTHGKSCR